MKEKTTVAFMGAGVEKSKTYDYLAGKKTFLHSDSAVLQRNFNQA